MVLRDGRTEAIPDLLAILAAFPVVEEPAMQADVDERDAMLAVLDALIEFGAEVPAGDSQRIYPEFPVQSLILLSRAPNDAQASTSPALLDIFKCERRRQAAWLAAGNVLLQRRPEGFAAAVIEGMTVHALVTVTQPGAGGLAAARHRVVVSVSRPNPRPDGRQWVSTGSLVAASMCGRVPLCWRRGPIRPTIKGMLMRVTRPLPNADAIWIAIWQASTTSRRCFWLPRISRRSARM